MNKRALKEFLSLPINPDETWQGGIVPVADLLGIAPDEGVGKMAMILWRSTSSELVHGKPVPLTEEDRHTEFVEVMLELSTGCDFPFRPARIECNDRELADGVSSLLGDSGTTVNFVAEMAEWKRVLKDLAKHLGSAGPQVPSLQDAGCNEQQIREFGDAAAAFYRAKLWDFLDDVDLIKIEAPKPPRHLKYAVVLGAGAETYGLGFYDDADKHYGLMAQTADPREMSLFNLTFESPAEAVSADVELWNALDLPLETGEAFPSMYYFSKEGPRRPTPKELDFTTIVLKALAATTEDEIDSGRWTKSVEFLGKRKRCVLTIPNLLDPPDRAEWIRRGMMPERRGNERHFKLVQEFIEKSGGDMTPEQLNAAINAKFTGPMDKIEYPMDTPADRADALCQEAIDAFGRRRVQLAKQALAEDPTHVEANILLAESTRAVDRRIELFRSAKEIGKTQLGPMLEEEVGHFWGITDTRPFMRACHGLATAFHEAGQTNEAIEQYREMLRLNLNDNQGVRYEVIPLLLAHNREAEAIQLLDQYREETAFWHYMKSLVEFRRDSLSAKSNKAMRSAFSANEHVVAQMQSNTPPMFPDSYSLGSPEEAAICICELAAAWDETDGYVEWMFQQYFLWEKEKTKRLRDRKRKQRKKTSSKKRLR